MTSIVEINDWFDEGVKKGKKYMLVLCDTFDRSDYPEYYDTIEMARRKRDNPGEMTKCMESYDLSAPKQPQMSAVRSHAI